jgi:tRNA pseudouridine38-40 synthase
MARYQVILAYDGTRYLGFQRQADGRTIQGEFEQALRKLGWVGSSILAAGRTDAGVSAAGQVVAFDLEWQHLPDELGEALNAHLPPELAARRVASVAEDFHPRLDAIARCYRYRLFCDPIRDPLRERRAWRVWPAADLELMQITTPALVGSHDFAAFGAPLQKGASTWRNVLWAGWQMEGSELVFEITAEAFLFRMVRRLVAAEVKIGQGRLAVDTVAGLLANPPSEQFQGLAPPHGLTLQQVFYPDNL